MANQEEVPRHYDIINDPEIPVGVQPAQQEETPSPLSTFTKASTNPEMTQLNVQHESESIAEVICPRVNCPEKILFALDFSKEMNETFFRSRVGEKMSAFRETVKALRIFVMNKSRINPNHEYGLALYNDTEFSWIQDFTKSKEILNVLQELHNAEPLPTEDFYLESMFDALNEQLILPEVVKDVRIVPPPYTVRVIFVYGRSQSIPIFTNKELHLKLESSPYFFLDVLYVHEPPSDENKCEAIFTSLCELDHKGLSYVLEAANLTRLFDCASMLLAHPLQRPLQRQADHHLASQPVEDHAHVIG